MVHTPSWRFFVGHPPNLCPPLALTQIFAASAGHDNILFLSLPPRISSSLFPFPCPVGIRSPRPALGMSLWTASPSAGPLPEAPPTAPAPQRPESFGGEVWRSNRPGSYNHCRGDPPLADSPLGGWTSAFDVSPLGGFCCAIITRTIRFLPQQWSVISLQSRLIYPRLSSWCRLDRPDPCGFQGEPPAKPLTQNKIADLRRYVFVVGGGGGCLHSEHGPFRFLPPFPSMSLHLRIYRVPALGAELKAKQEQMLAEEFPTGVPRVGTRRWVWG